MAMDRRQALLEVDVLAALAFGMSSDELCTIYRTQFPVLQGYEINDLYDAIGRKVPNEITKLYGQRGDSLTQEERTAANSAGNTYTYELPFVGVDREADMRHAYAHFTKLMEEMN